MRCFDVMSIIIRGRCATMLGGSVHTVGQCAVQTASAGLVGGHWSVRVYEVTDTCLYTFFSCLHVYWYVCVQICMYVCMYVCINTHTHACI